MEFVCFFKQKTADEMRIRDWSSDVCSSDLLRTARSRHLRLGLYQYLPLLGPEGTAVAAGLARGLRSIRTRGAQRGGERMTSFSKHRPFLREHEGRPFDKLRASGFEEEEANPPRPHKVRSPAR